MKKNNYLLSSRLTGKHSSMWVSVLTIVLTIITAGILLLLMGKNPAAAFYSFLQGCGLAPKENYGGGSGMLSDLSDFLNYLAPMLLAALAFIVAFKAGLFNIGIAGQMLLSGFLATALVGYSKDLPAGIAMPLVLVTGIAAGGLMGALIGFLKYRFNIHEVVSTIMINYIISYSTGFFINNKYVDMLTRTSRVCTPQSRLTLTNVQIAGVSCKVPLGLLIAVVMAFLVQFIFDRTTFGFELKAVGMNRQCAKYIGVDVGGSIVAAMAFSGVLAGLAGVTYYLGYTNTIIPKTLVGMGYDSISVALVGNSSPVGSIFAAVIVSIFQQGANYMNSRIGVAKEIASVITGILLLYASCGTYMKMLAENRIRKAADMIKNNADHDAERTNAAKKDSAESDSSKSSTGDKMNEKEGQS